MHHPHQMTGYPPSCLRSVPVTAGTIELVEWKWPGIFEFTRTEEDLMIEMSLPPLAADSSACLTSLAPTTRVTMGSLFVRWPGIEISGRGEGGKIQVIRLVLCSEYKADILSEEPAPTLERLKSLLAIRSAALRQIMTLIDKEIRLEEQNSEAALNHLSELAVIELRRILKSRNKDRQNGRLAAWQFKRIRDRLSQAGSSPDVRELASLCGISPRHLHRQFLALTGKTVVAYITATEMERAKKLLRSSTTPIKAIAQQCGYGHESSFARAFRRATGASPLTFRHKSMSPDD